MSNWPTTVYATKLVQEMATDASEYLGALYLPMNTTTWRRGQGIRFKRFKSAYGMTKAHSLNATVKRVAPRGMDDVLLLPQYWKEADVISEEDMLTLADFIEEMELLSETGRLFAMRALGLNQRLETRLEWDRWMALRNGYKSGVTVDGKVIKIDYGIEDPTDAVADWSDLASAKPMTDIMAALQRLHGSGAKWADVVIPLAAATYLIDNASILDRVGGTNFIGDIGLGNIGGLIRRLIQGDSAVAGLPSIRNITVYGGVYTYDAGAKQPFLDPSIVHVLGGRTGPQPNAVVPQEEMLGEWASTSHVQKSGLRGQTIALETGKFLKVVDATDEDEEVRLTSGVYGAPVIYHPEWVENIETDI